ncbi:uncharacterized protein LOC131499340 isoform X2 [Neofelis nebulosa]|uniref:uncharacterized protein LOC131499340 isoform X2 n=1 Tax=Neofelis nebulosa TaxID=61452 RepID=UPI00272C7304|nr:uncharacterized protein LOC131499340 isoform X2 [Neofelis nebulosa]
MSAPEGQLGDTCKCALGTPGLRLSEDEGGGHAWSEHLGGRLLPELSRAANPAAVSEASSPREQQLSVRHRQAFLSNEDAPPTTQLSVNGPAGTRPGDTWQG